MSRMITGKSGMTDLKDYELDVDEYDVDEYDVLRERPVKKSEPLRRFGIQARFTGQPLGLPYIGWLYDWHHHRWYPAEARRDQALAALHGKSKRSFYSTQEYRTCQR